MAKLGTKKLKHVLPWLLVVLGAIGLICAFILSLEKIELLKNPDYQPSCNLNPVLSCGSIIRTPQASAFGFPNPFIGLVGYSVVVTVGMALFAGAQFKRWFWRGLQAGTTFGLLFCLWLAYQSLYSIGALCIYCMVVWSVTWPLFWYTTLHNLKEGHIRTPARFNNIVLFMQRHHADILVVWYVTIVALIIHRFWYYWSTIL